MPAFKLERYSYDPDSWFWKAFINPFHKVYSPLVRTNQVIFWSPELKDLFILRGDFQRLHIDTIEEIIDAAVQEELVPK